MKKEYLRNEDGHIKQYDRNIAKMNVFEYIYYKFTQWHFCLDILDGLKVYWYTIIELFTMTIIFIFLPIFMLFSAYITIKEAKKEMVEYEAKHKKDSL